jgi:hypothetical protein
MPACVLSDDLPGRGREAVVRHDDGLFAVADRGPQFTGDLGVRRRRLPDDQVVAAAQFDDVGAVLPADAAPLLRG